MRKKPLTHERLMEVLEYNPNTGDFIWVKRARCRYIGKIAGTPNWAGYIIIKIDGIRYRAHVLAWLYMTGEYPDHQIDHKDGNPSNNKWNNLRKCNNHQNAANKSKLNKNNTSGCTGVCWNKQNSKWMAHIRINYKRKTIGNFNNIEDAIKARREAEIKYFGEFAPGSKD